MSPGDETALLNKPRTKRIQQILGALLWYARMIDNTMHKALNTIAQKQSAPMELIEQWANHVLDDCATHPATSVTFKASNMQLKVYSDASYLNEPNARSSYTGYTFLGWNQPDNKPMRLNGCLEATVGILKLVAASATESELGGLFTNAQKTKVYRLTLGKM